MTNRTKYTLFSKHDDPELQTFLDENKNVLVEVGSEVLLLKQRKSSLGTFWSLKFINDSIEIYGRFEGRECPDIQEFLKIVKNHLK